MGPLLGGILVDAAGWEWIFFVNVPVGVIGFVLAWRLVPQLETHGHSFDWLGVALSAAGMFLVTFGIQEREKFGWVGLGVLVLFLLWQARIRTEPLVPLTLFRDRNFCLGNAGIACTSLAITATFLPFTFYAQAARGWSPTQAALLGAPMAVIMMLVSRPVGRLVDTVHPRSITVFGFGSGALTLLWLAHELQSIDTPVWLLCAPMAVFGLSNSAMWGPLAATATRNLPHSAAGAGSGVYNTVRQVGAVLGSAAIAALLASRLSAHQLSADAFSLTAGQMPKADMAPFAEAMSESLLLPAVTLALGFVIVLFLTKPSYVRTVSPNRTDPAP